MSCKWDARVYLCRLCLIEHSGGASAHASAVFTGKTYVQACLTYVFIGWPVLALRFTHDTINADLSFHQDTSISETKSQLAEDLPEFHEVRLYIGEKEMAC
jgi:hypothetical protein